MRSARLAAGLLLLIALAVPSVPAQATCPAVETWGTDPEGDAGALLNTTPLVVNGALDIVSIAIGQGGDDCENLVLTLEVSNSLVTDVGIPGQPAVLGAEVTIDLGDISGAPDYEFLFRIAERLVIDEILSDSSVALLVDDAIVYDTEDTAGPLVFTQDGDFFTVTLPVDEFDTLGFTGYDASSIELLSDTLPDQIYQADEASLDLNYVFGFGIGFEFPPDIDLTLAAEPTEVFAGKTTSADVDAEIFNATDDVTYNITLVATGPEGWTVVVDPDLLQFWSDNPTNETTLNITVPADTPFGDYTITVDAYFQGAIIESTDLIVSVVDDLLGDPDGDGLINQDEDTHGSDRNNPDTDGEGLLDGEEVHDHGTDPTLADTDGDGDSDKEELDCGADPLDPDVKCQNWFEKLDYLPYAVAAWLVAVALYLGAILGRWK